MDTVADLIVPGRELPESTIGTRVETAKSWDEVLEAAGLDWDVVEKPMYFRTGKSYKRITHRRAMVRSDTEEMLGIVGPAYQPWPNRDAGAFLENLVADGATFQQAGGYGRGGGQYVYASLKLNDPIVLPLPGDGGEVEDILEPYIYWRTAHEGSRQNSVDLVVMRLVCTNGLTLPVAVRSIRIRHTGNVNAKMEAAQEVFGRWGVYKAATERAAKNLAGKELGDSEREEFLRKLFPSTREVDGEEASAQTQERRDAVSNILFTAEDLAPFRSSRWGMYNAVVQFVDHEVEFKDAKSSVGAERRLDSLVDGADLKDRAYQLLRS